MTHIDDDGRCPHCYQRFVDEQQYTDDLEIALSQREAEIERLQVELAETRALLDCRAGKLLRKGKTFIVVAVDEPYFTFVFGLIRKQELKRGTWSEIDEEWYQDACSEWMHLKAVEEEGGA